MPGDVENGWCSTHRSWARTIKNSLEMDGEGGFPKGVGCRLLFMQHIRCRSILIMMVVAEVAGVGNSAFMKLYQGIETDDKNDRCDETALMDDF